MIYVLGTWYITCCVVRFAECWPIGKEGARCINHLVFLYVSVGIEIVADMMVMVLPVPIIVRLHLPRRTITGLVGLFWCGLM